MTTWEEYHTAWDRLPITNPALEDMLRLCPHLTTNEVKEAYRNGSSVACPPLRVRGAFHLLEMDCRTRIPFCLSYQGARRTRGSYATTHTRGDMFDEYPFMAKAIQFAEENWSDRLMLDTWEDVIRIHLEDPSDLVKSHGRSYPSSKGVLTVCVGRGWNDILNDRSKPESFLIDESVIAMSFDRQFGGQMSHELLGDRGGYDNFSCAHCGDGLHLSGCGGCLHLFDDNGFRSGWATPLSGKMVECLHANGHGFKRDPRIAQEAEVSRFEIAQRLRAIKENASQT